MKDELRHVWSFCFLLVYSKIQMYVIFILHLLKSCQYLFVPVNLKTCKTELIVLKNIKASILSLLVSFVSCEVVVLILYGSPKQKKKIIKHDDVWCDYFKPFLN